MNIAQAAVELHKIQEIIDKLVIRRKELIAERDFYTEKFETGEIGQVLYSMRMTPIFFESGLVKAEYKKQVNHFNQIYGSYIILKSFEDEEEETEQV